MASTDVLVRSGIPFTFEGMPDARSFLVSVGCQDITYEIDLPSVGDVWIARGGYSDIYRGRLLSGMNVAIKCCRTSEVSTPSKRTINEIYIWNKLKHPNIHPLLGWSIIQGRLGMVSAWLGYGTLPHYLRAVPDVDRRRLCEQISDGLQYIHESRIIHGDLKGSNVLVSYDGTARVTDFGESLIKPDGTLQWTTANEKRFSIRWAAPELLEVTGRKSFGSDVYSLGMTILEAFSGKVPYYQKKDFEVVFAVAKGQLPLRPESIILLNEDGDKLWSLLLACGSRDPGQRPSVSKVRETLGEMNPGNFGTPDGSELPSGVATDSTTISRFMSLSDVIACLVPRHCADLSKDLDMSTISPIPAFNGASGNVYSVRRRDTSCVAAKTRRVSEDGLQNAINRVHTSREIYIWSKCKHPNVLPLLGVAVLQDSLAMISPWMKNGNLRFYLGKNPNADRCELSVYISRGLEYLHSLGIAHGDLKGDNVLISDEGVALLTDLGSANLTSRTMDFTPFINSDTWTLRWGAPEVLEGQIPRSEEADIYALGMTVLEAITGKAPYQGKTDVAVTLSVVIKHELPERPTAHIPNNSRDGERLWRLLCDCWNQEIVKRPSAALVSKILKSITQAGLVSSEPAFMERRENNDIDNERYYDGVSPSA